MVINKILILAIVVVIVAGTGMAAIFPQDFFNGNNTENSTNQTNQTNETQKKQ